MSLLLAEAPRWFELDPGATPDILGGLLICLLTLAIFSFLYRDNPVYKLAEHLFIGVGTAWYTLQNYDGGVKGAVLDYFADGAYKLSHATGSASVTQDMGGYPVAIGWAMFWRAMAVALSVMLLWRLLQRNAWISRWPLALIVGIYAALKMTGETQARLVQQIKETMVAIWFPDATWVQVAGNLVLVLGLVCILAHFIFTWRRNAVLGGMSRVGVIILMLAFGSRFGFTVLGRIALLIERVSELKDYTAPGYSLGPDHGWLQAALTPPYLLGLLIVLLIALGSLLRRRRAEA